MVPRIEMGEKEKKREVVESRVEARDRVRKEELLQLQSSGLWALARSKRASVPTSFGQRRARIRRNFEQEQEQVQCDGIGSCMAVREQWVGR
jgi:hypothetical protein